MKHQYHTVVDCHLTQSGYTLIELMIALAIIGTLAAIATVGTLAAIATVNYQVQVRQTQVMTIYQEINHYRMTYQILMSEGAGVTDYSPSGLNMPRASKLTPAVKSVQLNLGDFSYAA